MRKFTCYFSLILSLWSLDAHSQERCGTDKTTNPSFEKWLQHEISHRRSLRFLNSETIYEVPVVVHVFHNGENMGEGSNLSNDRIKGQIDSLNADFRRLNEDRVNTPMAFEPIAADVGISFVLAKTDPAGNPTDGIVRIRAEKTLYTPGSRSDQLSLRTQSYWNPDKYLNIYVAELKNFLGLAIFPNSSLPGISFDSDSRYIDAVFVDHEYFGVNPDAGLFESKGRTLTHEIGHYLGLLHIWGDGNCSRDDFVTDTPPADQDNGGISSPCIWPNPQDSEICEEGNPEMFQNYMDYTDDVCMNLFTLGQRSRMRTVIESSPTRSSLPISPALISPISVENDLAIEQILDPKEAICIFNSPSTLVVANVGSNEITSYTVQSYLDDDLIEEVEKTSISLLPLEVDTLSFNTINISNPPSSLTYRISMVNGTTDGNNTNDEKSVTILSSSSLSTPYWETFEEIDSIAGSFGADLPWEKVNAPNSSAGNQALVFKTFNSGDWFGRTRIVKTPSFDFTSLPSGELRFSYAHALTSEPFYDGLVIKASTDCGETFDETLFSLFGPDLSTAPQTDAFFVPANQLEWADTVVSINEYREIDGVQFAIIGVGGKGNNIYVDNLSILETNDLKNDVKPVRIDAPLATCAEEVSVRLTIRNQGSEPVNSFSIRYTVAGQVYTQTYDQLDIPSRGFQTFTLPPLQLIEGENPLAIEIENVNNVADASPEANTLETLLIKDNERDDFPLLVDFEEETNWMSVSGSTNMTWQVQSIFSGNALKAPGFNPPRLGEQMAFISPELTFGNLDSAKLYFDVSYGQVPDREDRLEVYLSTDCSVNPSTNLKIFEVTSDSLASAISNGQWIPSSAEDWITFEVNLERAILAKDEIRLMFLFTSGGGNDLYLDNISIREGELPTQPERMRVYPNPATYRFNVQFNLPKKQEVVVRLVDPSGREVYRERITNAFNQVIELKAPSQQGLYFLNISNSRFSTTEKVFINR